MTLDIHFLNVGHGDCTIVDINGRLTVIDINNSMVLDDTTATELDELADAEGTKALIEALVKGDSQFSFGSTKDYYFKSLVQKYRSKLTDPVDYLKANFPGRTIHRFILTHPDMDHMTGLYRLHQEGIEISNFWDTNHNKEIANSWEHVGRFDGRDWEEYKRIRDDFTIRKFQLNRGDKNQFWEDDGIYIASPTKELETLAEKNQDWNHLSYVVFINYANQWVILGGDASLEAWESMYDAFSEWMKAAPIRILKASHHGRDSGYHQPSVAAMRPDYTVLSVGKLPDTDASNKYRHYSKVFTTRQHGNITARLWADGDVWFYNEKGELVNPEVLTAV